MAENKQIFEVESGVTSVFLDTDTLSSAAGLKLEGTNNTVPPSSEKFSVGFNITDKTNFTFSTDGDTFTPESGSIEHTGTATFGTDLGPVTVGDFSIGFDASRQTETNSGFFVKDTAGTGAILFDVANVDEDDDDIVVQGNKLTFDDADLLVSSEFAGFLSSQGLAHSDLTGADVGDVGINAMLL
jgi:hypothetical protein